MRRTRWVLLAGASVAAFMVGQALTHANADDTAPTPVAFCDMVTPADAQAVLGGAPRQTNAGKACSYTVLDGTKVRSLTVMAPDAAISSDNFQETMNDYADKVGAALRRLDAGDEAWAVMGPQISVAVGRVGDHFLTATLMDSEGTVEDHATRLTSILSTALSRYGS